MLDHLVSVGAPLVRRSLEDGSDVRLPAWFILSTLFAVLVFGVPLVYLSYTLGTVFPALASIEDPAPPAYEPVSLNDDGESVAEDDGGAAPRTTATATAPKNDSDAASYRPTTASLRATERLLYSVGGWRAHFRGLGCRLTAFVAAVLLGSLFASVTPSLWSLGVLAANLACVQLSAAWVHIVITPSSPLPFWHRLPPLRRTFEATCAPVAALWLASAVANHVPLLLATALGLDDGSRTRHRGADSAKALVVALVALLLWAALKVPAAVLLVRVQASLLPPDEDTIVPFDRSFGGVVEPLVVGGKGYVSLRDAFRTVSRASWIRIYLLHAKVFLVSLAMSALFLAVFAPQYLIATRA